jgi:hypothetical protein
VSECRLSWPHDAVACSPSCAADWLERVIIFVARSTPTSFCREILASRKRAATILAFLYAGSEVKERCKYYMSVFGKSYTCRKEPLCLISPSHNLAERWDQCSFNPVAFSRFSMRLRA